MKIWLALLLAVYTNSSDLQTMRCHFSSLSNDEQHVIALKKISRSTQVVTENLKTAYFAAAQMASAQYLMNPFTRLNTFNSGKKNLEASLKAEPENIEIRFIRFAVQNKCPAFLGYNKNQQEDKAFMLQHLPSLRTSDKELYAFISSFMLLHTQLNEEEKKLFH